MKEKKVIQAYINNFRRKFTQYLKPDIGLACKIYPAEKNGAIIEFNIGPNIENDDTYVTISGSVQSALESIKQNAFGGELDGFVFRGTNAIIDSNRIIFIKDDSEQEWNTFAVEKDIASIINLPDKEKS